MIKKIDHNLFTLKRQLELKKNRSYTWLEIEAASGVHRNTLINLSKNATRRIDLDIAARLLNFFQSEGLAIRLSDLFTVTIDQPGVQGGGAELDKIHEDR